MKTFYKALAFTITLMSTFIKAERCEVEVPPPWERNTYVPQGSSVEMNCTAKSSEHSPVWSILLSGSTAISQFSFTQSIRLLNSRGFYELTLPDVQPGTLKTIQLLINSTEINNGTLIKCNDVGSSTLFAETTLIIYEPSPVIMNTNDIRLQTVNVSWSFQSQSIYTLTILNSRKTQPQTQIHQLHQHYFIFTAPEGAPPCEVYNFSVTATYIGATYTGAGCSVPSPVINRMLPSLPDIDALVSSINFLLEKRFIGITLMISFQTARYCEMYPVTNYTMEIKQVSSGSDVQSFASVTNCIIVDGLLENVIYMFRITAVNSASSASSDAIKVYTTDVQMVIVQEVESANFNVQCHFIPGSDAQGCMVLLIGQFDNHTMTLIRRRADMLHSEQLELKYRTLSCYHSVVVYDVESDGSIGTLAVPGHLETSTSTNRQCLSTKDSLESSTVSLSGSKGVITHHALIKAILMISVYITFKYV